MENIKVLAIDISPKHPQGVFVEKLDEDELYITIRFGNGEVTALEKEKYSVYPLMDFDDWVQGDTFFSLVSFGYILIAKCGGNVNLPVVGFTYDELVGRPLGWEEPVCYTVSPDAYKNPYYDNLVNIMISNGWLSAGEERYFVTKHGAQQIIDIVEQVAGGAPPIGITPRVVATAEDEAHLIFQYTVMWPVAGAESVEDGFIQ